MKLPRHHGAGRLGLGIILVLSLLAGPAALFSQGPSSDYEALRLLTEAFHEINQKFVSPKKETNLLEGALRGMMSSLDPDSSYLSAQEFADYRKGALGAAAEAGMELVFKDHVLTVVSVLDGGPAARSGVKAGDHILRIDGQIIRNLTTQAGMRRFQGPVGKKLKIQVLRNGLLKPLDLTLSLEPLAPAPLVVKVLPEGYAYLRIPYFSDEVPKKLDDILTGLKKRAPPVKGLILDLRNNARGSLEQAVRTASLFVGDREIVSTKGRDNGYEQHYRGSPREQVFTPPAPLIILVDQGTARAAEIVAGALKHHSQGVLLGVKTFGLCGLTQIRPLQDGAALLLTVAHCYTPRGLKITGTGLEPDVEGKKAGEGVVKLTYPGGPPENDPWVQQAVELLKSGKATPTGQRG